MKNTELIATDLHYAVDSSGWEWNVYKKALTYERDYGVASKNADAKWKRDTFPKGLGKSLNEIALVYEETEEDKYFWFQSKILNGYTLSDRDSPDPHGWTKRKEGLRKVKQWFKYDKEVCKGEKELEFTTEGRAPWMDIAIQEAKVYGGKKQEQIQNRVSIYHRKGANYDGIKDAWCSSFACWCLENSNPSFKTPHSAASASFINHKTVEKCDVFFGAIATFSDCDINGNIESTGHVTFVYGILPGNKIYAVLGGNQNNMIKISIYDCSGNVFYSHYSKKRGKHVYKKFRGFYKPKGYIVKSEDNLINSDNYATADSANKKIGLGSLRTTTGEKDD